mgnify:FL=1
MYKYILKRLLMLIPVLIGVFTIAFILNQMMPGDPARQLVGETATEEAYQSMREQLGLNRPLIQQYFDYLKNLVIHGDLGTSYTTKQPVMTEILGRMPTTLILAGLSVLVSVGIGVPLGICAATWQNSPIDYCSTLLSLLGVSMPNFWQGLMNILIFSVYLHWLPSSGFYGPTYWILPVLTVGTSSMATITRTTRASMLEAIRQDYIRTARAKGQSERKVIVHHALKNALIPIITVAGLQFGGLLGGAVLTESVFAIPGVGKYMLDAISARNYPVILGGVLVLALIYRLINLLVDVIYAYADPRMKSQYRTVKKKGGTV